MDQPGVHVAVKGIVVKGDRFLALQQKFGGQIWWDLPGGRINYGESPQESLEREIFEETKLNVDIIKPVGVWHFFRNPDKAQVVCFTFLCKLKSGEVTLDENPDDTENLIKYQWLTPKEFLKNKDALTDDGLKNIVASLKL